MRISIYFFILSFLFSSCRTSFNKKTSATPEATIYTVQKTIEEACFSSSKPSFLAVISTIQNAIPPFQVEGAWRDHFTALEIKLVGILGEDYGKIRFDVNSDTNPLPNLLQERNPRIVSLFNFIKDLKPLGVRQLICGHNTFFSEENPAIFYIEKNENTLNNNQDVYFSETKLNYNDHGLNLQNQILFSKRPSGESELEILSRYTYGFFNQDAMRTRWLAYLSQKNQVTVKKILFNVENTDYLIDFIDYN